MNLKLIVLYKHLYFFDNISECFTFACDGEERYKKFYKRNFFEKCLDKCIKFCKFKKNKLLSFLALRFLKKKYSAQFLSLLFNDNRLVIFDHCLSTCLNYYLLNYVEANYKIFLWNPVESLDWSNLSIHSKDKLLTYSYRDSLNYDIIYVGTFYNEKFFIDKQLSKKYNFYFLGKDKGRAKELNDFCKECKKFNLIAYVEIWGDINKSLTEVKFLNQFIPYYEYLERVLETECLIDISNKNNAITLRVLEALFLEKKLITNNKDIMSMDFYNPNNILVLDKIDCNFDKILDFLRCDYIKIESEILKNYTSEFFFQKCMKVFEHA